MLFQGNKSLLMYATFRDSKGLVEYLLRVEGFNSLTDTDEVCSYYNYYNIIAISLSLSHSHAHTYTHTCFYLDILTLEWGNDTLFCC